MTLSIRDVPDDVREALTQDAREHGQSLQAYLLELLKREAGFRKNLEVVARARRDLALHSGSGVEASDIVEAIHQAREERDEQIMRAVLRSDEPT